MIPATLLFSMVVFVASYLIARANLDKGFLAFCIILIAWCSLLFGFFVALTVL